MARLMIRVPGRPPFTLELTKRRIVLGRSARSDLCVDDPFVSRVHAEIRDREGTWWVIDLGSANGTYVNGVRLRRARPIAPGDRIQIGETILELLPSTAPEIEPSEGQEIIMHPEMTTSSAERPALAPELFTLLDSAVAPSSLPPEMERNRRLLSVITRVGVVLLSSLSLEEALKQIVALVLEAVPAQRAFLFLRGAQGEMLCKAACYRGQEPSEVPPYVRLSRSVTEEVIGRGRPVLTSDAQVDERFRERNSILLSGIRSIMAVPLRAGRRESSEHADRERPIVGMIYVDNPLSAGAFSEDDMHVLTLVASIAGIKIENAQLLEQRLEDERIRQQLAQARDLQFHLLPLAPPEIEGYDLTGISFPCYEVGGDYFDFIRTPEDELVFALGDVCGKGMDAAMLMSALHASVRAQVLRHAPVAEMVAAINRYLWETTAPHKFATLWIARLNPRAHVLSYTNAGHHPALLVRAQGDVEFLERGGIPVGCFEEASYEQEDVPLEPEDVLVLFSDGISESTNEWGEEFGVARLVDIVRECRGHRAASLRDRIEESLSHFLGKARPTDDMTLVILKRTS